MTQSASGDTQTNKQSERLSEEYLARQRAGKTEKSSHDHMSREQAGKDEGAGGGARQQERH